MIERHAQTSTGQFSSKHTQALLAATMAAGVAAGLGTGYPGAGQAHPIYVVPAPGSAYVAANDTSYLNVPVKPSRTAQQDLDLVRSVFRPSTIDMGTLFGVSRQAIYNWMGGSEPEGDNRMRLADFANIAEQIQSAGLDNPGALLKMRAFSEGPASLLERFASHMLSETDITRLIDEARKADAAHHQMLASASEGRRLHTGGNALSTLTIPATLSE